MASKKKPIEQSQEDKQRQGQMQSEQSQQSEEQRPQSRQSQMTNEEQMQTRQSAPRQESDLPERLAEAERMYQEEQARRQQSVGGRNPDGSVDGFEALAQPIGKEAVQKATTILNKYKEGKANLEARIIENEQWYKLRHWECMRRSNSNKEPGQVEPTSAWLFNCIANKHADAIDAYPSPNVLPREEGDKGEAEMLTSILPVILDMNDFEAVYDEVWTYKLKTGTGVYGVYWDSQKLNGLGDVTVKKVDLLSLFWQPGITDIQQSRNLFHVDLVDNDVLIGMYPQLEGKLGQSTINVSKYIYDDSVDTTNKSAVIDWYYKKVTGSKQVLHYVKYVNNEVLFATENDPNFADGLYEHGKYPFILDPLFKTEGTPTGFGYIDIGKSNQEYIDRGNQAIMENMLSNAKPRYFIRNDGAVNEAEFGDITKDFVHVDGNLGQDSVLPIQGKQLNEIYVTVINNKIDELKETTGNRDISTGGTSSGITAASAIAAMQEAGSKLSRDASKSAYRVFRQLCLMVIELIRQFYDLPRCFRIMGQNGTARFVQYSNQGIKPQDQGMDFGLDMGLRIPMFDIEITAQKASPYSKMSQNELALQFYSAGMFSPQMADAALICLDMMDFDRKDFVQQKIAQQAGMLQQLMMLAQIIDQYRGDNMTSTAIAQQYGFAAPSQDAEDESQNEEKPGNAKTSSGVGESGVTKNARERVAESTTPR